MPKFICKSCSMVLPRSLRADGPNFTDDPVLPYGICINCESADSQDEEE